VDAAPRSWLWSSLRDAVLLPLLLLYIGALLLAATPPEIRPAWLDRASQRTSRALAALGIVPGHAVFTSPSASDDVPRAYCVRIQGRVAGSERADLFRPEPLCPTPEIRWSLPPLQRAVHRMLVTAQLGADRLPQQSLRLHRDLGRYWCTRSYLADRSLAEVSLAWWLVRVNYRTGAQTTAPQLYLRFDCNRQQIVSRVWAPTTEQLRRLAGGLPWED